MPPASRVVKANETHDEDHLLQEFQSKLETAGLFHPETWDSHALIRFLKATSLDVPHAIEKWKAFINWRAEEKVDSILNEALLTQDQQIRFMKLFPHGLAGVDSKGQPVLIYRVGKTDSVALLAEFSEKTRVRIHIQLYEFINKVVFPACSVAANKRIDRLTIIYDLQNVNVMHASSYQKVFRPPATVVGDRYPEQLSQLLIINAPSVFNVSFSSVKALLPSSTQKKIFVFGSKCEKALKPHLGDLDVSSLIANNKGPWTTLYQEAQKKLERIKTSRTMGQAAAAAMKITDDSNLKEEDDEGSSASPDQVKVKDDELIQDAGLDELLPIERASLSFRSCLSINESRFFSAYLASPSGRFVPGQGTLRRSLNHSTVYEDDDEGELEDPDHEGRNSKIGASMGHGMTGSGRNEVAKRRARGWGFLCCAADH